ncbi:hypothetical protein PT974_10172 [Cladobotryum mycophilum]|uniref:Uncharacterized protein n=1 Tax=Cladobotryum mycophilum TaxID=491253 RepID=A0ABR0SAK1_9HYPO
MALTRSAGRALAGGQPRNRHHHRYPSRRSRASHARSTDISDESTHSDGGAESQDIASDTTESDAGPPKQSPRRSARIATDKSTKRRLPRSITRQTSTRSQTKNPLSSMTTPTKKSRPTAKSKTSLHRRRISTSSLDKQRDDVTLHSTDEKPPKPSFQTGWTLESPMIAFTEPALTAIYRCPIIRTPTKAKRLAALLERNPVETLFNYRAKIEFLHIDIHIVPQAVLYQLIHPLLRLKELVIFTPMDQPPYRKLDTNVRWHYPEDVFKALLPSTASLGTVTGKPFPTVLKSWEWSGRLIGGYVATIGDIAHIHQKPSFAHLTRVSFTNFQVPSLRDLDITTDDEDGESQSYREDGLVIEAVGHAISQLKSLRHLVFESSTVMSNRLLPLLPKHLHHLELINCWEIRSEDLAPFLRTHGGDLRTLTLLHNQSLNLAFLTELADSCPNLRVLHMNLSYYRHHDTVNDSDPMYDYALLPSQVPKWPSSLRVLNIENIRNWNQDTAEMFLQSIREKSDNLPHLRYLAIKTMLDIPWQSRAELRSKWRPELERIFLRPFAPPRKSSTIQRSIAAEDSPPLARGREGNNQLRHLAEARPLYRELDTDEEEFDVSEESASEELSQPGTTDCGALSNIAETAIQGRCNTVSIIFDNQKPRELQYGMEDFLDGEDSEEEWDGDDDEEDAIVVF